MNMLDLGPPLLAALVIAVVVLQMRKKSAAPAKAAQQPEKEKDEPEKDERPEALCFFGSQTGTAEGFAKELVGELGKKGFKARAVDLEDVGPEDLEPSAEPRYFLYFMATYGEGDPTDNALDFISFLNKGADEGGPQEGAAENVYYAVFGLGNTEYEQYNEMGKVVFKRLGELGGTALAPLGLGDDNEDIEEDFSNWREGVADAFARQAFGADGQQANGGGEAGPDAGAQYDFVGRFVPAPEDPARLEQEGRRDLSHSRADDARVDLSCRHLFHGVPAKVVENRELRRKTRANGGAGSTVHVEFDLAEAGLSYKTADNLTVCPANEAEQVETAARIVGLDRHLDQWFTLEPTSPESIKKLFPTPCTVRTALTYFTDLNGAPTRSLLGKLAALASMPEHRERLRFLASKQGNEDFARFITGKHLSVVELLETFPSIKVTEQSLGAFFEVMPRLKGREFTISSSALAQPARVALTVGVVHEDKPGEPGGRVLKGVCSTYLQGLSAGREALVFVQPSTFKLPADPRTPVIMIGPGTGIAPMRAFVQERMHQRATLQAEIGPALLFFGCRRADEDFLYEEELRAAVEAGALTELHTAFSRQQAEKIYVQHVMREQRERLWELIGQGAYVFVCGATGMGRDVHTALVEIAREVGGLSAESAAAFVKDLQQKHRYVQELWSS